MIAKHLPHEYGRPVFFEYAVYVAPSELQPAGARKGLTDLFEQQADQDTDRGGQEKIQPIPFQP